MTDLPVRIVELEPMTLICFNGFGEQPELLAFDQLKAWMETQPEKGRIFGYNNPDPSAGSPNYGYDACMEVDEDTQPVEEARIRHLEGGKYAVLHCPVIKPWEDIPGGWQSLVQWADEHDYSLGQHQWLEEHFYSQDPDSEHTFELDLYMPIQ